MLKLDEAQDYYMDVLQTYDAPWLHWLIGICLESKKESSPAEEEYLQCLNLKAEPRDASAVRSAVERQPNIAGCRGSPAAIAVRRDQVGCRGRDGGKRAEGSRDHRRDRGVSAASGAFRNGRRPFAGRFVSSRPKSGRILHGIEGQIARANAEKDGGTDEDRNLFKRPTDAHRPRHVRIFRLRADRPSLLETPFGRGRAASQSSGNAPGGGVVADCRRWGFARLAASGDEVRRPRRDAAPAAAAADAGADDDVNPAITPIDLRMLDVFIKRIREQGPAMADQAEAACVCLAAAIESLHEAVANFDKAIGLNPDLVEAYRDRGLGYYRLAQCEAILAAVEDVDASRRVRRPRRPLPFRGRRRRISIVPWWTGEAFRESDQAPGRGQGGRQALSRHGDEGHCQRRGGHGEEFRHRGDQAG